MNGLKIIESSFVNQNFVICIVNQRIKLFYGESLTFIHFKVCFSFHLPCMYFFETPLTSNRFGLIVKVVHIQKSIVKQYLKLKGFFLTHADVKDLKLHYCI